MVKVAPSLLAADFRAMGAEIERMAAAGADYLHFDVMDGAFVPNITFGSGICKFAAQGPLPVDAHLMVERPEAQVKTSPKPARRSSPSTPRPEVICTARSPSSANTAASPASPSTRPPRRIACAICCPASTSCW